MIEEDPHFFTGFLLEWPTRAIQQEDLLLCSRLHFEGMIGDSNWERYQYYSKHALKGEDLEIYSAPFRYHLLVRRSDKRMLFLSPTRRISEYIIDKEFEVLFRPVLRKVRIAVDRLVKTMTSNPTFYVLNLVHARVPGSGTSLKTVSFYGDDVAEAPLFRELVSRMNFFTCGLKHATDGNELVRLGTEGAVSFSIGEDEKKVLEVEQVLRFLREKQYLTGYFLHKD